MWKSEQDITHVAIPGNQWRRVVPRTLAHGGDTHSPRRILKNKVLSLSQNHMSRQVTGKREAKQTMDVMLIFTVEMKTCDDRRTVETMFFSCRLMFRLVQ